MDYKRIRPVRRNLWVGGTLDSDQLHHGFSGRSDLCLRQNGLVYFTVGSRL
jgi:hypothetical protein